MFKGYKLAENQDFSSNQNLQIINCPVVYIVLWQEPMAIIK